MTDKATSFVMDSEDLATQTRRVTPLANAYRKLGTRLGAPLNDEFHALILLASNDAATFDVSEDDFVAVARQQFILARGARRGTLAADLLRIDALTSGLTETKAENKRLREREELLARLLGVADLGQWRADWEAPISPAKSSRSSSRSSREVRPTPSGPSAVASPTRSPSNW